MRCNECRENLSSRLDGESEPSPQRDVDQHLVECAACRSWWDAAQRMQRSISVRPAMAVPDLTESILREARPMRGPRYARIALAVIATLQLAMSLAHVLGVADGLHRAHDHAFMLDHLSNESTSWNIAVGIGLLWAAWRPGAAFGQLPVISGFVAVLGVASVGDLITGAVTWERLLSHALIVLGLAVMFLVHRHHRRRPTPNPVSGDEQSVGDPAAEDMLDPARRRTRAGKRTA